MGGTIGRNGKKKKKNIGFWTYWAGAYPTKGTLILKSTSSRNYPVLS